MPFGGARRDRLCSACSWQQYGVPQAPAPDFVRTRGTIHKTASAERRREHTPIFMRRGVASRHDDFVVLRRPLPSARLSKRPSARLGAYFAPNTRSRNKYRSRYLSGSAFVTTSRRSTGVLVPEFAAGHSGKPGAVRIPRLHEVDDVALERLRHLVVVRRPGIDLVRAEIAEGVLDLGGMRGAPRRARGALSRDASPGAGACRSSDTPAACRPARAASATSTCSSR